MPAPKVPYSPKFDGRLGRSGGFVWYSEMDLDSLRWWHGKKLEASKEGGQYAESNGKAAAALDKWIQWRVVFPETRWSGTRGDDKTTADAPSGHPKLNEWPGKGKSDAKQQPSTQHTQREEKPPDD